MPWQPGAGSFGVLGPPPPPLHGDPPFIDTQQDGIQNIGNYTSLFWGPAQFMNAAIFANGQPWVDVLAYGADPTGVTDSTAAIQGAASAAAGGVLYFPPGTYLVSGSSTITVPSNTDLRGNATVKLKNSSNTTNHFWFLGSGCTVSDLTFDGNYTNQTFSTSDTRGLVSIGPSVSGVSIYNCTFQNAWSNGIDNLGNNVLIQNCTFTNLGQGTTSIFAGAVNQYAAISQVRFYHNYVSGVGLPGTNGVGIGGGTNCSHFEIVGNTFQNCSEFCIGLGTTGQYVLIDGNYINHSGSSNAVDLGTWSDITFSNNTVISTNTGTGIACGPPIYRFSMIGNRVIGPGAGTSSLSSGISVGGTVALPAVQSVISNNIVYNWALSGISVSNASNLVISDNVTFNNGQNTGQAGGSRCGIVVSSGANVSVTGNHSLDLQGTPTQQYGINLTNSPTNVLVANNSFSGNGTRNANYTIGSFQGLGWASRNNIGVNPIGSFTPQSVPASGTASSGEICDSTIYITCGAGVTVSAVKIGATTITGLTVAASSTSGPVRIEAAQTITLTYAGGTPTWQWFGD